MPVELRVPEVGESITEVQIGKWLTGAGENAQKDQPLVEIETDKVTLELPAPITGRITRVLKERGSSATVGEVIGYMEEAGADTPEPSVNADDMGGESAAIKAKESQQAAPPKKPAAGHVMPAAARAMAEHTVEAKDVTGTGPGGRVLKEDVMRAAESRGASPAPAPAAPASAPAPKAPTPTPVSADGREVEVVPMSPMRRRIAERLVEAQQTAALLTTFNEVDMTAVMDLRNQHKDTFAQRYGIKLGFMSFFVKAAVDALKNYPAINAEVRGNDIVYRNYYDVGVAIGSGKGLVVPVVRNAERLSFAQIELAIEDYAKKVKENKLELKDLEGGTFTISNGGVYGSLLSTPIVNPPQSGILGLHAIQKRPVVVDDQIAIRPMMYIALTYDHRIVDGREAVSFLKRIKDVIEQPSRMLVEI